MSELGKNIVDIDENLRLIGTAHISSASVELVRSQIKEWSPDLVAVESDSYTHLTLPTNREV